MVTFSTTAPLTSGTPAGILGSNCASAVPASAMSRKNARARDDMPHCSPAREQGDQAVEETLSSRTYGATPLLARLAADKHRPWLASQSGLEKKYPDPACLPAPLPD